MSACKRHATDPVRGYADCPGCEIERLVRERHEARRDRDAAQAEARELRQSRRDAIDMANDNAVLAAEAMQERDELRAELERVREALSDYCHQHKCGCGHPACKRCRDDRHVEAALSQPAEQPSEDCPGCNEDQMDCECGYLAWEHTKQSVEPAQREGS